MKSDVANLESCFDQIKHTRIDRFVRIYDAANNNKTARDKECIPFYWSYPHCMHVHVVIHLGMEQSRLSNNLDFVSQQCLNKA